MPDKTYDPDRYLDLVGTGCPMNLVYAKFELARMESGQVVEIILDDGAPVTNVTRSVQEEGHQLLHTIQLEDGNWAILVRKK